jgi:uncharacterized membrane protein
MITNLKYIFLYFKKVNNYSLVSMKNVVQSHSNFSIMTMIYFIFWFIVITIIVKKIGGRARIIIQIYK